MFVKEFPSVAIDEDDEDTFQHEEDVLLRWVSNFKSRLTLQEIWKWFSPFVDDKIYVTPINVH